MYDFNQVIHFDSKITQIFNLNHFHFNDYYLIYLILNLLDCFISMDSSKYNQRAITSPKSYLVFKNIIFQLAIVITLK